MKHKSATDSLRPGQLDRLVDKIKDRPAETYMTRKKRKLEGKRLETFNKFWKIFQYPSGKAAAADSWLDIPTLTDQIVADILLGAKAEAIRRPRLKDAGRTPIMAQGWITARRWEDDLGQNSVPAKPEVSGNGYDGMVRALNILSNLGINKFNEFCAGINMDINDQLATYYKWKMSTCQNPICRNRGCDVKRLARSAVRGV